VGTLSKVQKRSGSGLDRKSAGPSHLACPFCNSYDVDRLFLASLNLDSCECASCGARWDEDKGSGEYLGRAQPASVLIPRRN